MKYVLILIWLMIELENYLRNYSILHTLSDGMATPADSIGGGLTVGYVSATWSKRCSSIRICSLSMALLCSCVG